MLSNIPQPAIPGHVIGMVSFADSKNVSVYWNSDLKKVVYNAGRDWLLSEDLVTTDALSSIFDVPKADLVISGFRLLEHGMEITKNSDIENFASCNWSDYCHDNMCVSVKFEAQRGVSVPGGE